MTHAGAVIRFFAIGVDSRSADSEQDRSQPIQESRRGLDSRSKHAPCGGLPPVGGDSMFARENARQQEIR